MCLVSLMERIRIGQVTGATGIRGEIKVYDYGDDPGRYSSFDELVIADTAYRVQKAGTRKNLVVLKLEGVDTRDDAEKMRGMDVMIDEDRLPDLPEGTYYIKDLISFDVVDEEGRHVGVLTDILTNTPQRLYVVKTDEGREAYVPGVDEYIRDIDTDRKTITIRVIEGLID